MKLRLDHYNIRTTKVQETIDFYTSVLGLRSGYRPSTRPGAWLYDDPQALKELEAHLGVRDLDSLNGSGAIDHVAFLGPDFIASREQLVRLGIPYTERDVPQISLKQLFVTDPNGVTVELNFKQK